MRKLGLLAAAAGLALGGSTAKADFVISSTRTAGPTINSAATDIVDFTVTNNGANGTGTTIKSFDVGLYSPSGMYIGVRTGANAGIPDVLFQQLASQSLSWIADEAFHTPPTSPEQPALGNGGNLAGISQLVLPLGQNPSTGTGVLTNTFTQNQLVQGIYAFLQTTGTADASPLWFARAVVPHNASVSLLNTGGTATAPTGSGRSFAPNSGLLSPGSGSFAAINNNGVSGAFTDAVPEPGTLSLVGIGAAGLLARRRRIA